MHRRRDHSQTPGLRRGDCIRRARGLADVGEVVLADVLVEATEDDGLIRELAQVELATADEAEDEADREQRQKGDEGDRVGEACARAEGLLKLVREAVAYLPC